MNYKCPICDSNNVDPVVKGVWDSPKRNVHKCQKCAVVFLHPMMSQAETKQMYKEYDTFIKKRISEKQYIDLENEETRESKRHLNLLKQYLKPTFTLADIGASYGYFLELAKPFVKSIVGIEPSQEAGDKLKSKNIKHYSWLEDIKNDQLKFDLVTMFHVFEHLDKPIEYLDNLKKCLEKDALVCVELPNIDDVLISKYNSKAFKKFYFHSTHCFYYNEKTLSHVFEKSGFQLVKCHYIQRYPLANHLQWMLYGATKDDHKFNKQFESVNEAYADILAKEKVTDTIMCVFQKIN
jgi:2-polyprenyl-3-methyl-5-hydroxy-6-metoxy-1,4-benzoquinol methylase